MFGFLTAYLVFLTILSVLAGDSFVLKIVYLFAGIYLLGGWWSRRSLQGLQIERSFRPRAFPREEVPVSLQIHNTSRLPVIWLHLQDKLPLEISRHRSFMQVVSIAPRASSRLAYILQPQKRGYYPVGPLLIKGGDLLGLLPEHRSEGVVSHLTVFPEIYPISELNLQTHSPLGSLSYSQPIFEDPSRPRGKRDYAVGDPLRRIDWKSSAAAGKLQTRLFSPTVNLEMAMFLNLDQQDYSFRNRMGVSELAITVAASLATWGAHQRQAVGLYCNGSDPIGKDGLAQNITPRKGRLQLGLILETLARVNLTGGISLEQMLHLCWPHLRWGTTITIITPQARTELLDELMLARRAGLQAVLVLCGSQSDNFETRRLAEQLHIWAVQVESPKDMSELA